MNEEEELFNTWLQRL